MGSVGRDARIMEKKTIREGLFNKKNTQIAPSLITLDMLRILDNVKELEHAGSKLIHVDILDGHFSPSMPLGFELVRQLKKSTGLAFDCHVMTSNPDFFVDELIGIGVEQISFQIETANHIDELINRIHNAGIRAGVALKPATPISDLEYIIEKCDNVLLMLINPGYASNGEEMQIEYGKRKIKDLNSLIVSRGCNTLIEVDGRISQKNLEEFPKLGVNIFVAGSTCLEKTSLSNSFKECTCSLGRGCIDTDLVVF